MSEQQSSPGIASAQDDLALAHLIYEHISDSSTADFYNIAETGLRNIAMMAAKASINYFADRGTGCDAQASPDQRLTEDMTLAHNARKTALREMADFFNESVHHVWSNDEIASCLTDMISAVTPSPVAGEPFNEILKHVRAPNRPTSERLDRIEAICVAALAMTSTPETTRNLVESLCEDCPKPQCLVCPRRAEGK